MAKHPNYEFIVAFAEGKEVEFKYCESGPWYLVEYLHHLSDDSMIFRIKPKTRMINGFEVPCAMDKEPREGDSYYYSDITLYELYSKGTYNSAWDKKNFDRGICFSNKENAIAVAKAMLGIDPNS